RCRPAVPQLARSARPSRDQPGAHRRADRLPPRDARQPGLEGPAREERLDRRLQDRRRVRRVHRRAGRARVRDPRGVGTAVSETATRPPGTVDKAQYGLAAALLVVGVYTIIDARGLTVGFGDPIGPRVFPYLIGTGMI